MCINEEVGEENEHDADNFIEEYKQIRESCFEEVYDGDVSVGMYVDQSFGVSKSNLYGLETDPDNIHKLK
jgi:hypothetical protein